MSTPEVSVTTPAPATQIDPAVVVSIIKEVSAFMEGLKNQDPSKVNVAPGVNSSEFRIADNVSKALMLLGILAPILDAVCSSFQHTTFGSSLWITALSIIAKTLVSTNYTNARTTVKTAGLAAQSQAQ